MRIAVSTVQPLLGSIRSGLSGKASCSLRIVSISRSGSSTPPFSFRDRNPFSATRMRASSTSASGVSTGPQRSLPGWSAGFSNLKNR